MIQQRTPGEKRAYIEGYRAGVRVVCDRLDRTFASDKAAQEWAEKEREIHDRIADNVEATIK